ncbi:hypothetical protein BDA99DRAFT_525390 [Phascolomyces articulosus]|uniref:Uncharacterized protein n=1 Tax=Phascolomyces articulosus TaxID=60185 RepID=A0AAD5JPF8_9FUNG|nr:hypothetical protein BDA99DRAFT_525390 [Phascolomyces articulosus]
MIDGYKGGNIFFYILSQYYDLHLYFTTLLYYNEQHEYITNVKIELTCSLMELYWINVQLFSFQLF